MDGSPLPEGFAVRSHERVLRIALPEPETTESHCYDPVLTRSDAARVADHATAVLLGPNPPGAVEILRHPRMTPARAEDFAARVATLLADKGFHAPVTTAVDPSYESALPTAFATVSPGDTAGLEDELDRFLSEAEQTPGIQSPVPRSPSRPREKKDAASPKGDAPVRHHRAIDRLRRRP